MRLRQIPWRRGASRSRPGTKRRHRPGERSLEYPRCEIPPTRSAKRVMRLRLSKPHSNHDRDICEPLIRRIDPGIARFPEQRLAIAELPANAEPGVPAEFRA